MSENVGPRMHLQIILIRIGINVSYVTFTNYNISLYTCNSSYFSRLVYFSVLVFSRVNHTTQTFNNSTYFIKIGNLYRYISTTVNASLLRENLI